MSNAYKLDVKSFNSGVYEVFTMRPIVSAIKHATSKHETTVVPMQSDKKVGKGTSVVDSRASGKSTGPSSRK